MARAGGVLKPSATQSRWTPQDPSGSTSVEGSKPDSERRLIGYAQSSAGAFILNIRARLITVETNK